MTTYNVQTNGAYSYLFTLNSTQVLEFCIYPTKTLRVGTVDESTGILTFGTATDINTLAINWSNVSVRPKIITLSDTKAVMVYGGTSGYLSVFIITVSGTTASIGTVYVINSSVVTSADSTAIDETHFAVAYESGSYLVSKIYQVSGTTISECGYPDGFNLIVGKPTEVFYENNYLYILYVTLYDLSIISYYYHNNNLYTSNRSIEKTLTSLTATSTYYVHNQNTSTRKLENNKYCTTFAYKENSATSGSANYLFIWDATTSGTPISVNTTLSYYYLVVLGPTGRVIEQGGEVYCYYIIAPNSGGSKLYYNRYTYSGYTLTAQETNTLVGSVATNNEYDKIHLLEFIQNRLWGIHWMQPFNMGYKSYYQIYFIPNENDQLAIDLKIENSSSSVVHISTSFGSSLSISNYLSSFFDISTNYQQKLSIDSSLASTPIYNSSFIISLVTSEEYKYAREYSGTIISISTPFTSNIIEDCQEPVTTNTYFEDNITALQNQREDILKASEISDEVIVNSEIK